MSDEFLFGSKPIINSWDIPENTIIYGVFKNFPKGEDVIPISSKDGQPQTKYRKYEVVLEKELKYGINEVCEVEDVIDIKLPIKAVSFAWQRSSIKKPDLTKSSKDISLGLLKSTKKLYHFVSIDGNEINKQRLQSITSPPPDIESVNGA